MTLAQEQLINNYNSLMTKVTTPHINIIIPFCIYFQSDDEELYKEFEPLYTDMLFGNIRTDDIIKLYAKRYNLDSEKDIDKIMQIFINNTIDNGFSYHLNSSANYDSIMENGLGISAIGLKTEERIDYEFLQQNIRADVFKKLQPFVGEKKGSKLYYSNIPILNARYGDRPEWLKELRANKDLANMNLQEQELVNHVLEKYDKKYTGSEKMLFLIPNPFTAKKNAFLEHCSTRLNPEQIISLIISQVLLQKDLFTSEHVAPENILSIDLGTLNIQLASERQDTYTI